MNSVRIVRGGFKEEMPPWGFKGRTGVFQEDKKEGLAESQWYEIASSIQALTLAQAETK